MLLHCLISYIHVTYVSGRGLPLLVDDCIAEMGFRVFGSARLINHCHPRSDLIEDLSLTAQDSRQDNSGMTVDFPAYQQAPSLLLQTPE
ncbi:hypothetical protein CMT41_16920 [Colwellia sp. MT41]|nr:hypothetical protein CMT41_16920 [Colwellia sp. MT41]